MYMAGLMKNGKLVIVLAFSLRFLHYVDAFVSDPRMESNKCYDLPQTGFSAKFSQQSKIFANCRAKIFYSTFMPLTKIGFKS